MQALSDIFSSNVFDNGSDFQKAEPFPMTVIDNFLPVDIAKSMFDEANSIEHENWKRFTRNGSSMLEFNRMAHMPVAFHVTNFLHSNYALESLSKVTGIKGLIPDPHLVGAGYSLSHAGSTLKVHTDFNWNDTLKLHRALSLIIYLTPDWNTDWNGGLDFYDSKRENVVTHVDCLFNRCLIWKYNKYGWHGHTKPLSCPTDKPRTCFRLFYYTSNSTYLEDDPPHRSQYWIDKTGKPYDNKEEK